MTDRVSRSDREDDLRSAIIRLRTSLPLPVAYRDINDVDLVELTRRIDRLTSYIQDCIRQD